MKTYFVIRGQHILPLGYKVLEFENVNIFEFLSQIWVTNYLDCQNVDTKSDEDIWGFIEDNDIEVVITDEWASELGYFFWVIFAMVKFGEAPTNYQSLAEWLKLIEGDNVANVENGLVEILGSTYTCQLTWLIFDDSYCNKKIFSEYLFYNDWQLPTTTIVDSKSNQQLKKENTVYCVFLCGSDSLTLSDILGVHEFSGGTLSDFDAEFMTKAPNNFLETQYMPMALMVLRAYLLKRQTTLLDLLSLSESEILALNIDISYVVYLMDQKQKNKLRSTKEKEILQGLKSFNVLCEDPCHTKAHQAQVQVSDHFAQLRFYDKHITGDDVMIQYYFDDVWVKQNEALAASIFEFAKGLYVEENKKY